MAGLAAFGGGALLPDGVFQRCPRRSAAAETKLVKL
jgi:hypothetical protein